MEFGKYRLLEKIGQGGMAEVFYAHVLGAAGFTKEVALKRVLSHLCEDTNFIKSFIDEARLGGLLNHHHIVQTLDFGDVDGIYYLAMEYVHGLTLRDVLNYHNRNKLSIPPGVVIDLVLQLSDGLRYAHQAEDQFGNPLQMVHRDLKPTNILVSAHGVVKIADFGIARAETNVRRTMLDGVLKGTAQYMSPEQAMGDLRIDRRSDIFSVGSITYELITGKPLFLDPSSSVNTLRNVQDARIDDALKKLNTDFPYARPLIPLLERVLARDPGDRPSEIGEVMPIMRRLHTSISRQIEMQPWTEQILAALGRPVKSRRSTAAPSQMSVPLYPAGDARAPGDARGAAGPAAGARSAGNLAAPEPPRSPAPPTAPSLPAMLEMESGTSYLQIDELLSMEENTPAVPLLELPGQPRLEGAAALAAREGASVGEPGWTAVASEPPPRLAAPTAGIGGHGPEPTRVSDGWVDELIPEATGFSELFADEDDGQDWMVPGESAGPRVESLLSPASGATPARRMTPMSMTPSVPVSPASATPARPMAPVSTTPSVPVSPPSTTPARPMAPVSTTPARPAVPASGTPGRPAAPVSPAPGPPAAPVSTTPARPVAPAQAASMPPAGYGQPTREATPTELNPAIRRAQAATAPPPTPSLAVPPRPASPPVSRPSSPPASPEVVSLVGGMLSSPGNPGEGSAPLAGSSGRYAALAGAGPKPPEASQPSPGLPWSMSFDEDEPGTVVATSAEVGRMREVAAERAAEVAQARSAASSSLPAPSSSAGSPVVESMLHGTPSGSKRAPAAPLPDLPTARVTRPGTAPSGTAPSGTAPSGTVPPGALPALGSSGQRLMATPELESFNSTEPGFAPVPSRNQVAGPPSSPRAPVSDWNDEDARATKMMSWDPAKADQYVAQISAPPREEPPSPAGGSLLEWNPAPEELAPRLEQWAHRSDPGPRTTGERSIPPTQGSYGNPRTSGSDSQGGYGQSGSHVQPPGGYGQSGSHVQPPSGYGQSGSHVQPQSSYGQTGSNIDPRSGYDQSGGWADPRTSGYGDAGRGNAWSEPGRSPSQPGFGQSGGYASPPASSGSFLEAPPAWSPSPAHSASRTGQTPMAPMGQLPPAATIQLPPGGLIRPPEQVAPPASGGSRRLLLAGLLALVVVVGGVGVFMTIHRQSAAPGGPVQTTLDTVPGSAEITFKDGGRPPGHTPMTIAVKPGESCVAVQIRHDGYELEDTCLPVNAQGFIEPKVLRPATRATDVVFYFPLDVSGLTLSIDEWEVDMRQRISRPNNQASVRTYISLARHKITARAPDCGEVAEDVDFTAENAYKFVKLMRGDGSPCTLKFVHEEQ